MPESGRALRRFFCADIRNNTELALDRQESYHLSKVMRLGPGDEVELFDGRGTIASAVVHQTAGKSVIVKTISAKKIPVRTSGRIIIASAVARKSLYEQVIEKCTELGADHIAGVIYQRTVKTADSEAARQRYQKIVLTAVKQCKRIFIPEISPPEKMFDALESLLRIYPNSVVLYGGFSENARPVTEIDFKGKDVIAFIGPEGGMTDDEMGMLIERGAAEVKITDTVLRVETAAAALSCVLSAERAAWK